MDKKENEAHSGNDSIDRIFSLEVNRRDVLKLSAAGLAAAGFSSLTSCSSLPEMHKPAFGSSQEVYLTNCNIVDVKSGRVKKNKTLLINKERIGKILDGSAELPPGAATININNNYLIPGLIDGHCHSTGPAAADFSVFKGMMLLKQIKRNYPQHIMSGTTTIRDMGAFKHYFHDYLDMIEEGSLTGPRVVFCNQMVNINGGHPDFTFSDISSFGGIIEMMSGDGAIRFKNTQELKDTIYKNYTCYGRGRKAHFLKLTMDDKSALCGKGAIPVYAEEHIKIIRDFAEKYNLPIACHVHRRYGFERSLEIGANSIEHIVADEVLPDKAIALMAKKKTAIVPTLSVGQVLAAEEAYKTLPKEFDTPFIRNELALRKKLIYQRQDRYCDPEIWEMNKAVLENYRTLKCEDMWEEGIVLTQPDLYFQFLTHGISNLKKMKQAGVLIGAGTDAGIPYIYNGTIWNEIELLTRAGFSNIEALRCATINNARILKMENDIGSLEKGKYADIVVLKENPLEKIEACRDPLVVFKGGSIEYSKKTLKQGADRVIQL
ncbi:MAG: amidohydrolase family protein [bacterium]|nr:amidohydrolase family protein [bacterium]